MAASSRDFGIQVNPAFRVVLDDWLARAGVFSALPDAPVVPDPPSRWRQWRRRCRG